MMFPLCWVESLSAEAIRVPANPRNHATSGRAHGEFLPEALKAMPRDNQGFQWSRVHP
jgi:hypothetical protein